MKTIVIKKKFNPFIDSDELEMKISDEVYALFLEHRAERERHRKRLKSKLTYVDTFEEACGYIESESCPIEESVKREEAQNVRKALKQLPEIQRRRVIARFFKEKTIEQIAETEGVDVAAIHRSISAALKKLRIICQEQKDA